MPAESEPARQRKGEDAAATGSSDRRLPRPAGPAHRPLVLGIPAHHDLVVVKLLAVASNPQVFEHRSNSSLTGPLKRGFPLSLISSFFLKSIRRGLTQTSSRLMPVVVRLIEVRLGARIAS